MGGRGNKDQGKKEERGKSQRTPKKNLKGNRKKKNQPVDRAVQNHPNAHQHCQESSLRPLWSLHYLVLCMNVGLAAYLLWGGSLSSWYGSGLHSFARFHPVFVHLFVGLLLGFLAYEIVCRVRWAQKESLRETKVALLLCGLADLTVLAGVMMQLIESYPNPLIKTHFLVAMLLYGCFLLLMRARHRAPQSSNVKVVVGCCVVGLMALLTGAIGGVVSKGVEFYTSAVRLDLLPLFKTHLFLSHLPIAIAVFLYFAIRSTNPKTRKVIYLISMLGLVLVGGTGAGLALRSPTWNVADIAHFISGIGLILGTGILLIVVERWHRLGRKWSNLLVGLNVYVSVVVVLGVLAAFGPNYFSNPWKLSEDPHLDLVQRDSGLEVFQASILPILDKKCASCHNASQMAGGLALNNLGTLLNSGRNLQFVTPGSLVKSELYHRVSTSVGAHGHMPVLSGMLSENERQLIRDWILAGALTSVDDTTSDAGSKYSDHWVLQTFTKPQVPAAATSDVSSEIDRFVFAKLAAEHVSHRVEASQPLELLRRVSIISTGLVPDLEAIEQTEQGRSLADSISKYLASEQFGVNLATFWLDYVGFAEESGFETVTNEPLPFSSKFKGTVIEALNADVDYMAFLREQLVWSTATKQRKSWTLIGYQPLFQKDPILSGIAVLKNYYSFTLGLSMECAQCHDHPYAPISNEDFYRQLTVFEPYYADLTRFVDYRFAIPYTGVQRIRDYETRKQRGKPIEAQFLNLFGGSLNDFQQWEPKGNADFPPRRFVGLSRWFTDTERGVGLYTARLFVDAVWEFVMGKGLVNNRSDVFSAANEPEYIDLLNWLTFDFLENGSSIKDLVRKIMSSKVFASQLAFEDPQDQALFALRGRRRMRAENLRDNTLYIGGRLKLDRVEAESFVEKRLTPQSEPVRTIYFMRQRLFPNFLGDHFPIPKGLQSIGMRKDNPSVHQVQFFLKGGLIGMSILRMSEAAAGSDEPFERTIENEYLKFYTRKPTAGEVELWEEFFRTGDREHNWILFFLTLVCSNEFLYT